MAEYICRENVLDNSNIITVHTKEYGSIDVIPVDTIVDIKLADVQPVKRGRWENTNTPNQLRCSKCEVIHFIAQYPHGEINFCPNCGARMDGDTNG